MAAREVFGPKAAELTGAFYRAMYEHNGYFQPKTETTGGGVQMECVATGLQGFVALGGI